MGFYTVSASWGELIGGWCAAVLYGINVLVFATCMYVLEKKCSSKTSPPRFLYACAIIQFLISTAHIALDLRLLMNAFLYASIGSDAYLAQETLPEQIALKVLYITNSAIGGAVLVWRMYVVWGSKWVCAILPSLMVIISAVTGYIATGIIAVHGDTSWKRVETYLIVSWSFSIATQLSATCLIAYRILNIVRSADYVAADERQKTRYVTIVWIVIESGALYTAATILLLVFFVLNTQASNVIGKAIGQIAAIVPTLIIVRVNLPGEMFRETSAETRPIKFLSVLSGGSKIPKALESDTNKPVTADDETDSAC